MSKFDKCMNSDCCKTFVSSFFGSLSAILLVLVIAMIASRFHGGKMHKIKMNHDVVTEKMSKNKMNQDVFPEKMNMIQEESQ